MSNEKIKPLSARKPIKRRKPKDKPKRQLSAYNFFFKEERAKITSAVKCKDDKRQKEIDPELSTDQLNKLREVNSRLRFSELGKVIGLRWRGVTNNLEQAAYYDSLAETDKERYKKEMIAYNERKEQISNEITLSNDYHSLHAQWYQMPHSRNQWETDVPPSGMHGYHMDYMSGYHIGPNTSHRSRQMHMTDSYNPHCRTSAPVSGMCGGHMGYMSGYHIGSNTSHRSGPNHMTNSYNPHYRTSAPVSEMHSDRMGYNY